MDVNDLRVIVTVLSYVTFIGIWAWAWSRKNRERFEEAAQAYERALARASERRGKRQQRWMLSPAEHCEDCVALAGEGWKPVTEPFVSPSTGQIAIPGNGATQCLTNCKCHVEYR